MLFWQSASVAISALEQSINTATTQIMNLYNYKQVDELAISALYQTTTTIINYLCDISAIVSNYHDMLASAKASGYTPLLVSEGLLPLNNSDYFLLGVRTFTMTNNIGCTANCNNFRQRYYEGDPCTRPGATTALCLTSDVAYGDIADQVLSSDELPMQISLNQQVDAVVQDPACSTITGSASTGNVPIAENACFANNNQCFWAQCGVMSGFCMQALYNTDLYNTTASGIEVLSGPSCSSICIFFFVSCGGLREDAFGWHAGRWYRQLGKCDLPHGGENILVRTPPFARIKFSVTATCLKVSVELISHAVLFSLSRSKKSLQLIDR